MTMFLAEPATIRKRAPAIWLVMIRRRCCLKRLKGEFAIGRSSTQRLSGGKQARSSLIRAKDYRLIGSNYENHDQAIIELDEAIIEPRAIC
jgi:hypothetical protein